MKLQEFRKLIREEVRKALNEEIENFDQKMGALSKTISTKLGLKVMKNTEYVKMANMDEPYAWSIKLPKGIVNVGLQKLGGNEVYYIDSNVVDYVDFAAEYNSLPDFIENLKMARLS